MSKVACFLLSAGACLAPGLFAHAADAAASTSQASAREADLARFAAEVAREYRQPAPAVLATLRQARFQQSIVDAMNRPAEAKPWKDYRPIFVSAQRDREGIAFYREHRELIERVAHEFHVAPEIVVAIIGVETSYGRVTGKYRVLDALYTLGFHYPPREKFFRGELAQFLGFGDAEFPEPLTQVRGSYAGAMGWGQFMPTSIAKYARDYDGDGKIDLWNSLPDIVASVANYFAAFGWEEDGPIALRAQPADGARTIDPGGSEPVYPLEQLVSWGYAPLQHYDPARPANLVRLDGEHGPEYWITFQNFYVITRYNRSPLYAMAVHQLAQAIAAGLQDSAP